jgi:hypothetical protein
MKTIEARFGVVVGRASSCLPRGNVFVATTARAGNLGVRRRVGGLNPDTSIGVNSGDM